MTLRLYVVPVVGTGSSRTDMRRPKYFETINKFWGASDYGLEPTMLVSADLSPAEHTSVTANADVSAIPADLDAQLTGAQVTATSNILESLNISSNWVNTTFTWRSMLRIVLGEVQFMQRYHAISGQRLFLTGVDLSTTVGSLPLQVRINLQATGNSFGYDTSSITGANTLRQILKTLGDNWANTQLTIGNLAI